MNTYQFSDTDYCNARDKMLTLQQWVTFLKGGCQRKHFTERLYKHLSLHCSFIAHYSLDGFYSVYFTSGDGKRRFFSQFDKRGPCLSVEYGGSYWGGNGYEDIKAAMIQEAAAYIPALIGEALEQQRFADISEAKRLLARHGIEIKETA